MSGAEIVDPTNCVPRQSDIRAHSLEQGLTRDKVQLKIITCLDEHFLPLYSLLVLKLLPWFAESLWHDDIDWHLNIPEVMLSSSNFLCQPVHLLEVKMQFLLTWLHPKAGISSHSIISYLTILHCFFTKFKCF